MVNIVKKLEQLKKKYRYSLILLKELVITDFKLRYQGSALGYLWSLLRPMFLFVIMYIVFVYFLRIGRGIPHWPVALLLGTVMWSFFAEVTNGGLKSIVSQSSLLRKINFPKYIVVVAGSISALINFGINLCVVFIFTLINGVELSWSMPLLLFYILELFIFGLGLAFILGTIYVKLRDIKHIWDILMQGLFYATGIFFPISTIAEQSPIIAKILLMSPVAHSIQGARHVFISKEIMSLSDLTPNILIQLLPLILTTVVFIFGAYIFRKKSSYFAEYA